MLRKVSSVFRFSLLALLSVSALSASPARAQQTADEIMGNVHQILDHFPSVVAEIDMRVITDKGERARQMRLLTRVEGERKQIIAVFRAPEDVADVGYASDINMKTGAQKSWVYFPSIGKVNPIKSTGRGDSFFGSDFSYSDISGRTPGQDSYVLAGDNADYFIIAATPKANNAAYSKLMYQISKSNFTIRSIVYFDDKGRELKRLSNLGFQEFEGVPVIALSVMENLQTGSRTELDRGDVQVDAILLDDDFGPEALSN